MKIQLIRNATMKLSYAGQTILTDPMLSAKDAYDPFAGVARNPTVELPHTLEQILDRVDGVLVSHGHPDHFDSVASAALPKTIPVLCQPDDEQRITEEGFRTVMGIRYQLFEQSLSDLPSGLATHSKNLKDKLF